MPIFGRPIGRTELAQFDLNGFVNIQDTVTRPSFWNAPAVTGLKAQTPALRLTKS